MRPLVAKLSSSTASGPHSAYARRAPFVAYATFPPFCGGIAPTGEGLRDSRGAPLLSLTRHFPPFCGEIAPKGEAFVLLIVIGECIRARAKSRAIGQLFDVMRLL